MSLKKSTNPIDYQSSRVDPWSKTRLTNGFLHYDGNTLITNGFLHYDGNTLMYKLNQNNYFSSIKISLNTFPLWIGLMFTIDANK